MKIVFIKDIPKLAKKNDIKEVADGYAKFLISNGSAVLANKDILSKVSLAKENKEIARKKTAEEFKFLADKLNDKTVTLNVKVNSKKHLFAAVHESDIARQIKKEFDLNINPKTIRINNVIKEIGRHKISINEGTMHIELNIEVTEKK